VRRRETVTTSSPWRKQALSNGGVYSADSGEFRWDLNPNRKKTRWSRSVRIHNRQRQDGRDKSLASVFLSSRGVPSRERKTKLKFERADMNQQALQNILMPSQMRASHSSSVVAVRKVRSISSPLFRKGLASVANVESPYHDPLTSLTRLCKRTYRRSGFAYPDGFA
jgi:hypothetical protein